MPSTKVMVTLNDTQHEQLSEGIPQMNSEDGAVLFDRPSPATGTGSRNGNQFNTINNGHEIHKGENVVMTPP